jgi:alpha-tubulin suppressor-like RCC1 family protein
MRRGQIFVRSSWCALSLAMTALFGCFEYPGSLEGPCNANGICAPGLSCVEGVCRASRAPDASGLADAAVADAEADLGVVEDADLVDDSGVQEDSGAPDDLGVASDGGDAFVDSGADDTGVPNDSGVANYVCGDGVIEDIELCDGLNLANQSCETLTPDTPFGAPLCVSGCLAFDTSGCHACGDGVCDPNESFVCATDCNWSKISVAQRSTCAIRENGSVWCWGENHMGELGDGSMTNRSRPTLSLPMPPMKAISIDSTTCAIEAVDGRVWCWGLNGRGELGNGTTVGPDPCAGFFDMRRWCNVTPAEVLATPPLTGALSIGANGSHVCALLDDGTIWCWGQNLDGELGRGTTGLTGSLPQQVLNITTATALAVGVNHNCALLADRTVSCWGSNHYGQLGIPDTTSHSSTPVSVAGLANVRAIAAGQWVSCAVLDDQTIRCWGSRHAGALGDGMPASGESSTPVTVSNIGDARSIHGVYDHFCAVRELGLVSCWGSNGDGQLCAGWTSASETAPVASLLAPTATIAAGGYVDVGRSINSGHTCAIFSDGRAECCGEGDLGQLGDGSSSTSTAPVLVQY